MENGFFTKLHDFLTLLLIKMNDYHPDSPAGGCGPGRSSMPSPVCSHNQANHPNAPANRHKTPHHKTHHKNNLNLDLIFRQKSPLIMTLLIHDFDLTDIQAAAIMGNIGHECNLFHSYHEIGQPENKGGYGWAQWTGARRKLFFSWITEHYPLFNWRNDIANYSYLRHELQTTQKSAISNLKKNNDLHSATVAFEMKFERAASGKEHFDMREKFAKIALEVYSKESLPEQIKEYLKSIFN